MSFFFCIVHNFIRQSYRDFELIYKINEILYPNIFPKVAFITTPIFNLYIISYNLAAKTLHIIYLQFINDQYIILLC